MDAVLLPPAAPAIARERHANPVVLGILVGAAVPAILASAGWWLNVPWVAAVAGAGIVVGAVLGALLGERMASEDWLGIALLAAFAAPIAPAIVITVGVALSAVSSMTSTDLATVATGVVGVAAFGLIALVVAEAGGLPITIPVAIVVAYLIRRAARMSMERAALHVGTLVVVALVVGLATVAANTGLLLPYGIGAVDPGY